MTSSGQRGRTASAGAREQTKAAAFSAAEDLITVRDFLRYGISRFTAEGLAFGHGSDNALDEAAFLILSTLSLPIDQLDPWLDARLTRAERQTVAEILEARIATRKPAAYLTGSAYIGPYRFAVDERVIVPRSFIGELLVADGLASAVADREAVGRVLDLCTGSGCLAILAALAFPNAEVIGADISEDALEVAAENVAAYGLEDRLSLVRSDLFASIPDEPFDVIVSNPPYVTAEAVAAFPPEYRAEPELAHLGGEDGLDLVRRILDEAPQRFSPGGVLVVEIGQARDRLEEAYPELELIWLDTTNSEGEVFMATAEQLASRKGRRRR